MTIGFAVGHQADGSYVLRFQSDNMRFDLAVTRFELDTAIREMEIARNSSHGTSLTYDPTNDRSNPEYKGPK